MTSYAFLGGSFDPIHLGHMTVLAEIQKKIDFTRLSFLPYNISPTNKTPIAPPTKRLAMVRLAISSFRSSMNAAQSLDIEEVDIQRDTPAYTYSSLRDLRRLYGEECHISFIMGDDCYATLDSWHRWDELCDFTNLLIINRDDAKPHEEVINHERQRIVLDLSSPTEKKDFLKHSRGCIAKLSLTPVKISSSSIRHSLANKEDVSDFIMPPVINYIKKHNLYA